MMYTAHAVSPDAQEVMAQIPTAHLMDIVTASEERNVVISRYGQTIEIFNIDAWLETGVPQTAVFVPSEYKN